MVLLQLQSEDAAHVRINTLSIEDIGTAMIEAVGTTVIWLVLLRIVVEALKTARHHKALSVRSGL